jgi:hypothetical protein
LRQIIVRGNGHEKPAFLITNDFDSPVELVVRNYSRRWRIENGIAEAVKFFPLNSLSSPILIKVHFDVVMTVIDDTLYSMLASRLRGFERCDAQTIYRHFMQGKAIVTVSRGKIVISYPKRAHNPILRGVRWERMPETLPGRPDVRLSMEFK